MCGIAAIWGPKNDMLLQRMTDAMRHRGPDGTGTLCMDNGQLGHLRLAIVDVDGGAQPMTNEKGDLAVVFNGEIYNHAYLRKDVELRHQFRTQSDTEILLHLYEEERENMLPMLDGMFAFVLAGPHGMLLARDPLGIKPLYYGRVDNSFLVASELKAFPKMDELHVLPAGHSVFVGCEPRPFTCYQDKYPVLTSISREEAADDIRRRLGNAVVKRLMSDVPLGVFLSGGLDSTIIASIMKEHIPNLHSFTAGMEGSSDIASARIVAEELGTIHHELIYSKEDILAALPDIIWTLESFDAPLVRSAIPMYFLSALAARHVKVVLTGEGADELFGGYDYLRNIEEDDLYSHELTEILNRLQDTNLQRADRISMRYGLEARVPFLDLDFVRYATSLPIQYRRPSDAFPAKELLREAYRGNLPKEAMSRAKQKFSEGAGSSDVIAKHVEETIPPIEFEAEREIAPGLILRSAEELYYYRMWRQALGANISPRLVGRTSDAKAAT